MSRHPAFLLFVCALSMCMIFCASQAFAQQGLSANVYIQQGQLHYNAQNYKKSEKSFKAALHSATTTSKDQIVALKYLGFISVILGKNKGTSYYFTQLLKLDPTFKFDASIPPKFVQAFNIVRKDFLAKRNVALKSLTPKEVSTELPLEIRIRATDYLKQVVKMVIYFRNEGESSFTKRTLQEVKNPNWKTASLPWFHIKINGRNSAACATPQKAPAVQSPQRYFSHIIPKFAGRIQAYQTEFYVEAFDKNKVIVSKLGSSNKPVYIKRTIPAKTPIKMAPTPITGKWWFWAAIVGGAAVVGAAVAIPLALSNQKPPALPSTGTVIVTVIQKTE